MKYVIGKRYKWSPYRSGSVPRGKEHIYIDGILQEIDLFGNGILISRLNEGWIVPLENLKRFK